MNRAHAACEFTVDGFVGREEKIITMTQTNGDTDESVVAALSDGRENDALSPGAARRLPCLPAAPLQRDQRGKVWDQP